LPGVGTEHARSSPWTVDEISFDVFDRFKPIAGSEPEPWGIVGLSLGGMVGLTLCELYPDWFSHVVVINTSSRPSSLFERIRPRALLGIIDALLEPRVESREALIYRLTTRLKRRDARDYALLATMFQEMHPVSRSTFARQLIAAARFTPPPELEQRVLVLASRADEMVSPACSRRLAKLLDAELSEHPAAGHDLPLEDGEWLVRRIQDWLSRTPELPTRRAPS